MNISLFDDFPSVSAKQWKQKIQFDLNGADYNNTLIKTSNEGIVIKPFFTSENQSENTAYFNTKHTVVKPDTIFDIIGNYAKNGRWETSEKTDFQKLNDTILATENQILIDTTIYHHAGANIVQQLTYGLIIADHYLTIFKQNISSKINFLFAVENNLFFEISKLKAIRQLWQWLLNNHKLPNQPTQIITVPSLKNNNNELHAIKISTQYISAILGDADIFNLSDNEITISPINNTTKNTYYTGYITQELIEKTITIFKLIKSSGGFIKQLEQGIIQKKIKQSAQKEGYKPIFQKNIRKTNFEPIGTIKTNVSANIDNLNLQLIQQKTNILNANLFSKIDRSNQAAGFPPFLRGITSTMYTQQAWINQPLEPNKNSKTIIKAQTDQKNTTENNLTQLLSKAFDSIKHNTNNIDDITQNIVFSFNINDNHFKEVAKLRAARVLWAKLVQQLQPKKTASMAMYIHCEIGGELISEKTIHSISAILGGTQSLNTLPEISNYLQNETEITSTIDPWGGNDIIENLTNQIITTVWTNLCKHYNF